MVIVLNASDDTFREISRYFPSYMPITQLTCYGGNVPEYLSSNKVAALKRLQEQHKRILVNGNGLLFEDDVKELKGETILIVFPSDAYDESAYWNYPLTRDWINTRYDFVPKILRIERNGNMSIKDSIQKAMMELGVDLDTYNSKPNTYEVSNPNTEPRCLDQVPQEISVNPPIVVTPTVETHTESPADEPEIPVADVEPVNTPTEQIPTECILLIPETLKLPRRIIDGKVYLEVKLTVPADNVKDVPTKKPAPPKVSNIKPTPNPVIRQSVKLDMSVSQLVAEKHRLDKAIAAARSIKDEDEVKKLRKQRRAIRDKIKTWSETNGSQDD